MRKPLIVSIIAIAVIAAASFAMLPPEAYDELREAAPIVVTGEVIADSMVKDTKDGEVRQFELEITEVERGKKLSAGDIIKVEYFVPDEEPDGPGGIRGAGVGDTYKLWLQPAEEDGVYEGAAYGSSLESLK